MIYTLKNAKQTHLHKFSAIFFLESVVELVIPVNRHQSQRCDRGSQLLLRAPIHEFPQ